MSLLKNVKLFELDDKVVCIYNDHSFVLNKGFEEKELINHLASLMLNDLNDLINYLIK